MFPWQGMLTTCVAYKGSSGVYVIEGWSYIVAEGVTARFQVCKQ